MSAVSNTDRQSAAMAQELALRARSRTSSGSSARARDAHGRPRRAGALRSDLDGCAVARSGARIGGMPRGRIVEVYGPESSGKTTLVYHVLAQAQRWGSLRVHRRGARDGPLYAREIGVDIDELLVSQPDYGEQALEIADVLVRSGAVDVVAIDSVAALTPRKELEGQMSDQTVGLQARMMSLAMRKLAAR